MSNYAYLCCSDLERIYPSFLNADYDPDEGTLACDVEAIPLLWFGLFRPADWRTEEFIVDGDRRQAEAPLVERQKGLEQLDAAVPLLEKLFDGWGSLQAHAALLRECVDDASGQFLSIEWEEVCCMFASESEFCGMDRRVLAYVERPGGDLPAIRKTLLTLASFEKTKNFPPARGFVDDLELSDTDFWNLTRMLGASHSRTVPWE